MTINIHHEWVDVFPIENGDFPASHDISFQGCNDLILLGKIWFTLWWANMASENYPFSIGDTSSQGPFSVAMLEGRVGFLVENQSGKLIDI